ncbi:fluoride efflux transporter FluC [Halarchaeum nitratireducens]|uniref:Fluoride-specific ion channel FluC n=1 Tax=Halarchaeum nitratireducens TaxID=489913 RepID=A0A830G7V5_9EURY|nr:CrcB family protein [Halarchaeum nitratireducens]MBP2251462.1 CrcB protein [Halarchaeum solikamskense]GGN07186.1 chromosome condensation protein CrcB [Halarchaeum nitratireducens]
MTPLTDPAYLVGVGGALGALLRTLVGELVTADAYPASTLVVNVVGSFCLAALTAAGAGDDLVLLLGTGACGSFTTFSSFAVETVRLWEDGDRPRAAVHAGANLGGAGVAIALAWLLVG